MRMFITLILTIMLLQCISNDSTAQVPTDVGGWNKAKWGMTESEIMKSFEGQVKKVELVNNPKYCSLFKIDSVTLLDEPFKAFKVLLMMDCNSNRLALVAIRTTTDWDTVDVTTQYAHKVVAFNRLEEQLIKKYGEPKISKSNPETISSRGRASAYRLWVFPSTEIRLTFSLNLSLGEFSFCDLHLNYEARQNNEFL